VAGRLEAFDSQPLALDELRQDLLFVVLLGFGVVRAGDIGAVETGEGDDLARGCEGASIRTWVRTPLASFICEARVRFQISS
jgi:hypothetical protein